MEKTATWVSGRRGLLIAAAALAAALAVALPLWFVFRGDESPPVVTQPTVVTTTMPGSTTTIPAATTTTTAAGSATSTTVPTTTTIPWAESLVSVVAVSADEVWASWATERFVEYQGVWQGGVAHFVDGARVTFNSGVQYVHGAWVAVDADLPNPVSGLAVAPDGTVWVSGGGGVFSFDGVEWTRRFDYSAGGVAVAPDGTVWIGGGAWLARWDDGSWVPVGPDPQEPPDMTGYVAEDAWGVMSGVAASDGEVWMVAYVEGWPDCTWLLHYDGATVWRIVSIGGLHDGGPGDNRACNDTCVDVEAAPNGDVWALLDPHDTGEWLLGRFDGEIWTTYTPPFEDGDVFLVDGMAVGPDGLVWFAPEYGLLSFDGTDWTYHLQGQQVSAVDVAPDGTVWYIDQDGAHILDN